MCQWVTWVVSYNLYVPNEKWIETFSYERRVEEGARVEFKIVSKAANKDGKVGMEARFKPNKTLI